MEQMAYLVITQCLHLKLTVGLIQHIIHTVRAKHICGQGCHIQEKIISENNDVKNECH